MSEPGTVFGRYVILERLGRGGMGVVFRAYDPELDRRVALKLVRFDDRHLAADSDEKTRSQDARLRLLREAQAMARVSHPNVISVYDVGSLGDEVFVAMELVDGRNLTAWLDERRRGPREVLQLFLQAGRGLAAAHAAGLVHRDFKPDNLLVGRDGRVRVLDFGLARALDEPPAPAATPAPAGAALVEELTATGAVLGTPAYMAPEQHLGRAIDPRSDQFSFCVALYQSLAGVRPFPGANADEISNAVVAGRLREPPSGTIPRFVWRALRRGLQVSPEERFPSMDALLQALGRDPRRYVRPAAGALGATIVLVAVASALRPAPPPCRDAGRDETWTAGRRDEVQRAFVASGAPFAAAAWAGTRARLDAYAGAIAAMRREACEATHVRHEQSSELLDLRMACLDERAGELDALATELARADRAVVERAPLAAGGLTRVESCSRTRELADAAWPPADPVARARVDELLRGVAEVQALKLAGKFPEALARAKALAGPAAAAGHQRTRARVLLALGDMTSRNGDASGARPVIDEAARTALAARDHRLAAVAYIDLAAIEGVELRRADEGRQHLALATALLEAGGGDPEIEARIAGVEGQILCDAGRGAEALPYLERAVARLERVRGPDDPETANAVNDLGGAYRMVGRPADALAAHERALAIRERALGPEHPFVATTIYNIGNVHYTQGRYAEAEAAYARAVAIRERSLGPEHPRVAEGLVSLAQSQEARGRRDEALATLQRALAIEERSLPPDHPEVGRTINTLADTQRGAGRLDDALASYRRALAIKERTLGPEHASTAITVFSLGETLLDLGRAGEALTAFQRALAIDRKNHGPDSVELAYDLTGIGRALIDSGKPADALAPLERALELRSSTSVDPIELGETRFALARALWAAGRDRTRALELGRRAREAFAAAEARDKEVASIDAWLAGRKPK